MSAPRKHPDIKFLQEVSVDFIKEFQKDGYLTKVLCFYCIVHDFCSLFVERRVHKNLEEAMVCS